MKKIMFGTLAALLCAVLIHPVSANPETLFTHDALITGGGIITEGHGRGAPKITFAVNMFIRFFVNEDGQPVDEYGEPVTDGQLFFAEPPEGYLQIQFHNTGNNDEIDKGRFITTDITAVAIRPGSFQDPDGEDNHIFTRIEANGKFNGEDGWAILTRFSDFGNPGITKRNPENHADATRIMLFDQDEVAYDTATAGDYPRQQAWRTLLDGGNVTVYYQH